MEYIFKKHFYYKYSAPNAKEFIDKILSEDISNSENFASWSTLCSVNTYLLDTHTYIPYLIPSMKLLRDEMGMDLNIGIEECWLNEYSRGGFQEIHNHIPSDMAAVFFVNDGEDFSKFYFWDKNSNDIATNFWRQKILYSGNHIYPDIKAGDIIFLPSYLMHGVSPHVSDQKRYTFSCNLVLNQND